jgi:membrane-bound lytic murein transglycosylase D
MSFTKDNTSQVNVAGKLQNGFFDDSKKIAGSIFPLYPSDPIGNDMFTLNASMASFVHDYLNKESKDLGSLKSWAGPYFNLFDRILTRNDLPVQLKYLAVIESNLHSGMASWAGAVGPWQLMPDEAKRYGLIISKTKTKDERTDFIKSTEVASKILKELYKEYNDWLLVVAAYNCGCGSLNKAIKKSGSTNFWKLQSFLPAETRMHVKKFIATHYFFEGAGGWTTVSSDEVTISKANLPQAKMKNTSSMEVSGKLNPIYTANALGMDIALFNELNPNLDKDLAEDETVILRLPVDKMRLFQEKKEQILQQSILGLLAGSSTK